MSDIFLRSRKNDKGWLVKVIHIGRDKEEMTFGGRVRGREGEE